jgi:hypothetical protein
MYNLYKLSCAGIELNTVVTDFRYTEFSIISLKVRENKRVKGRDERENSKERPEIRVHEIYLPFLFFAAQHIIKMSKYYILNKLMHMNIHLWTKLSLVD